MDVPLFGCSAQSAFDWQACMGLGYTGVQDPRDNQREYCL